MAKRFKKPLVTPEQKKGWLKRYEKGDSPQDIAKSDKVDIRTVRRHLEEAKQEREVKEARSMVLRNALEEHYRDLCNYAEQLDARVSGLTAASQPLTFFQQEEHIRTALHEHLPRSPIWNYLNQLDSLQEHINLIKKETNEKLSEEVKSDARLLSLLSEATEVGMPGVIAILYFQLDHWTQAYKGLNLEDSLFSEPAEEGFIKIRYGFAQMGKIKKDDVARLSEVLKDWESRIKKWEEYQKLEKSYIELNRVSRNLRDELAIIILRRIVPGRCRYCPL